jgi:RNA polymerase sigma-70 factor (ECF subfamily)
MADDAALWDQICAGDSSAFEALFREVGPRLRSFVRVYSGGQAEAEDIVQETFLGIWKRRDGYDPEKGSLRQYIYGIARKRAAQEWRESPPAAALTNATRASAAFEPRASGTNSELSATVRDGLMRLHADERGLLWLREVEGYSYAELAEILGVPLGTVKSRIFSARESLREIWMNEK